MAPGFTSGSITFDIEKSKWPHGWLRRIGEEPVVFDPAAAKRSAGQIESYLWSKGFFNARVDDSVMTAKKEAMVQYDVTLARPIPSLRYVMTIQDTLLYTLVMMDTSNCTVREG
ncbi:MAG: hypothetical protein U5L72_09480 [Bacteroidales bacterium]|nr:hypothetical protein [Bacteroidales bacterium]